MYTYLQVFQCYKTVCPTTSLTALEILQLLHNFPRLSMTLAVFHDFPGLENNLTKFHDFPGRVVTLLIAYPESGLQKWMTSKI